MAKCILVTEKEFAKAEHVFDSQQRFDVYSAPTEEQLLADTILKKKCRAAIVGVEAYSGPL